MITSGLSRRFWLLWAAFSGVNLADGVGLVALPLLAVTLTDDARLIALVLVFGTMPFLLIGLPAGVFLDRTDRRKVAILAQLARFAMLLVLAGLTFSDRVTMPWVLATAFVVGVGEIFTDGGLPAIVRELVAKEQLELANSRMSATQTVMNVFIGPPLGALAFSIDPALPLIAGAVLFLVPAGLLAVLPGDYRPAMNPDEQAESLRSQMMFGLRYVWGHPVLRPLALAVAVLSFVLAADHSVFVLLVTERFGLSEVSFGLITAIDGATSVIFAFFVPRLVRRTSHGLVMRIAIGCLFVASVLFGLSTVVVGLVLGAVLRGAANPAWNINSGSIRQRLVPDEVFGRMVTAYLVIAWGMRPVGGLVGGFVAERWGPERVYLMYAAIIGTMFFAAQPLFSAIAKAMKDETVTV